jgi:hypothetical protein
MKRKMSAALGATLLVATLGASAAAAPNTSNAVRCPGATRAATASRIDGSWRRDLPRAAWIKAGLSALDWETNGGRHTLTFDHGVWLDHDDVVGKPPDGCGPYTLKAGVLTGMWTGAGGASTPKRVLFKVRVTRSGDALRLVSLATFDSVGRYVFSGTWRKLG